jgi:acyl-CoA synthetase (AMP-forming)/AMP-acid ligase II
MADLASGMVAFAKLKPGDKVIIYAETQLEWMLAALAAFTQSLTVVTIYATLGEEGLAHGLSQTKAKLIIADAKLLPKVSKAVTAAGKEMASCKHVVYIGDPVKEHDEKGAAVTKQTLAGLTSEFLQAPFPARALLLRPFYQARSQQPCFLAAPSQARGTRDQADSRGPYQCASARRSPSTNLFALHPLSQSPFPSRNQHKQAPT